MPASFVLVVRLALVPGLISVTVAPATTFPCGSVTTPRTDDVPCAVALPTRRRSKNRLDRYRTTFLRTLCLFIGSSSGKGRYFVFIQESNVTLVSRKPAWEQ